MSMGTGEFIVLGVVLLVIFSASRMGTLGNSLGKFVYSFKKASKGDELIDVKPTRTLTRSTDDAQVVDGDHRKP